MASIFAANVNLAAVGHRVRAAPWIAYGESLGD
jgi:hypothetical protein